MSVRPVLPAMEQPNDAIRFFTTAIAEEITASRLPKEDRKPVRRRLREERAAWESSAVAGGATEDGIYALEHTARAIISRHEGIKHDRANHGGDPEFWVYCSPIDGLQRPFSCVLHGKCFTPAEVALLDNGQLPNVLLTAGGWCSRSGWSVSAGPIKGLEKIGVRGTLADIDAANAAAKEPWWAWAGSDE